MSVNTLNFPPVSHVGKGSLQNLVHEVEKYSPNHVLIITDPVLEENGVLNLIKDPLIKADYQVSVFNEVLPEPSLELGEKVVDYVRKSNCDLIIGLGGGSALDLAKAAAVISVHEGELKNYLNLTGNLKVKSKGLPKILIPTTSGTGSEVTNISVFSLGNTKDVIADNRLLADVAIVDSDLTLTMPKRLTAATGVDALTHAVEAYLSKNSSPTTDGLAIHAVKLIGESLVDAVKDGNHLEAREKMSQASYIAGLAFFNAGVAGVHALAYPLGGLYNIPHGQANAVLLPYVMNYIKDSCEDKMSDLAVAFNPKLYQHSKEKRKEEFINELFQLIKDIDLLEKISEYNIPESALQSLTDDALKQTRLLNRSPKKLNREDIYSIYYSAFHGLH